MKKRITIGLAVLFAVLVCASAEARVKKARLSVTLAETAATSLSVTRAIAGADENKVSGLLHRADFIVPAMVGTGTTCSLSLTTNDDNLVLYSKASVLEATTTSDPQTTPLPICGPVTLTLRTNTAQTTSCVVVVVLFTEE